MAGSNKVLTEGQLLFKAGDKSDGMYLIRKGELRVFLEQNGKEVSLATVGAGGMIGEMALFDGAPRSASVKAMGECEVTQITTDDFGKLMKQIPKWFVGLMSALSTRLRQTNERLQKVEAGGGASNTGGKTRPYQNIFRQLNVLILLWHKDGQKDGKDFTLVKQAVESTMIELFNEDPEKLKGLFDVLIKEKILTTKQDSYKNVVLAMSNRAALTQLATFIATWLKANPTMPCLKDDALQVLRTLERLALASPYDTVTVTIDDLKKDGKRENLAVDTWPQAMNAFQNAGEEVKLVKTSTGVGLKTAKKDISAYTRYHETLAAIYKANLA